MWTKKGVNPFVSPSQGFVSEKSSSSTRDKSSSFRDLLNKESNSISFAWNDSSSLEPYHEAYNDGNHSIWDGEQTLSRLRSISDPLTLNPRQHTEFDVRNRSFSFPVTLELSKGTAAPQSHKKQKNRINLLKSPSFNIYDRKVSPFLQNAFDAIHGFPFRGSMAHISSVSTEERGWRVMESETQVAPRFKGPAVVECLSKSPDLRIKVESAGHDDGNYASVTVNGNVYQSNARGLFVCIVNITDTSVVSETFDTHSAQEEKVLERMRMFLQSNFTDQQSAMKIVCVASKDESSKNLKVEGWKILRSIGCSISAPDNSVLLSDIIKEGKLSPSQTPSLLGICSKANASRCASVLVQNGWKVDYKAKHGIGNSALHDALFHGSRETAICLIQNGARTDLKNRIGETASDMIRKGFAKTVEEFINIDPKEPINLMDESQDTLRSVLNAIDIQL